MLRLWRRWVRWRDSRRGQAIQGWTLLGVGLAGAIVAAALAFDSVDVPEQFWLVAGLAILVGLVLLKRSVDPR